MTQDKHAAIALVDQRVAKLISAKPTRGKALDLTEVATITNSHEDEHERSRPDMMAGPGKRSAPGVTRSAPAHRPRRSTRPTGSYSHPASR